MHRCWLIGFQSIWTQVISYPSRFVPTLVIISYPFLFCHFVPSNNHFVPILVISNLDQMCTKLVYGTHFGHFVPNSDGLACVSLWISTVQWNPARFLFVLKMCPRTYRIIHFPPLFVLSYWQVASKSHISYTSNTL